MISEISSPDDLKRIPESNLKILADEIRKKIIEVVGHNGGHLASNLGVVELTIALHRVFSSPSDAIIWDVSHQCYAHKLLTGRAGEFSGLRQNAGISGFTRTSESVHDFFDSGHASTSISSGIGLLEARRLSGNDGNVVAVIGDGALTGGMAFEGLCHAALLSKNLIVVLNDNQMSISPNEGSLSRYLSRLTMTSHYQNIRRGIDSMIDRIPFFNKLLSKMVYRFKRGLKGLFLFNNLFVDLGFEYVGPLDGHDEAELEMVFRRVKDLNKPVVVHVVTKKGKGYSPAENDPELFHGIGPFCISDGKMEKYDTLSFTEQFSDSIIKLSESNEKIACITAAMAKGTGLALFAHRHPERFFDVGIAEEHAVTFAGGLAKGGMVPFVCIYSTFMQRSVDQMIHDVALSGLHAVFMLDRAGAVPGDGETHQGVFDIALFRNIPNVAFLAPASAVELDAFMKYAVEASGPVIIRYPKNSCPAENDAFALPVQTGRGVLVKGNSIVSEASIPERKSDGLRLLFVCTGGIYPEVQSAARALILEGCDADIYNLRFIKPFDRDYFVETAMPYDAVVIVEDGMASGGIGEVIKLALLENGKSCVYHMGFPDRFMGQGTRHEVLQNAFLSSSDIQTEALGALNAARSKRM